MFKNVYYDTRRSEIHLWETVKGQDLYTCIPWVPYVFVTSSDSAIRTIDGITVEKKYFNTYKEYNAFQKDNTRIYENRVQPVIQFLAEYYHGIEDTDIIAPDLTIHYEDIEVIAERGFPNVQEAASPIVLISITHANGTKVFGIHPFDEAEEGIDYELCSNEEDLLRKYFKWKAKNPCDIVTGWNYSYDSKMNKYAAFDLPYIIRRTKNVFGQKTTLYKSLSPIGIVRISEVKNSPSFNVDIAGVTVLDQMSVYLWYTANNLEERGLGYVANLELGEGKLDMGGLTFREFYEQRWNDFVRYNIRDSQLLKGLEDKLGYFNLIQSLSLLCKAPMKFFSGMVALIEGLLITHYRRNGLCAPTFFGGTQEHFPAAFVKDPKRGLHDWIVDLDITSSYPTAVITLNMSQETYYGRIVGFSKQQLEDYKRGIGVHDEKDMETDGKPFYDLVKGLVKKRTFPQFYVLKDTGFSLVKGEKLKKFNLAMKKGLLSVAPCGSVFMNKPKGVFAEVSKNVFMKRKEEKGNMARLYKLAEDTQGARQKEKYLELAKQKFSFQWALKIIINAMFGVTSVPYSRYFNVHVSEAITSCGRNTILEGQFFVNELLNNPEQSDRLMKIVEHIKQNIKKQKDK